MREKIRRHSTTIIVAMIVAAITAGAPSVAHVTSSWTHLRDEHIKPFADSRYAKKTEPYILEAGPADDGVVQPLNNTRMNNYCRDLDGCEVTLAMINWNAPAEPGNVASRTYILFISQTSRWWRFNDDADSSGLDNNDATQGISAWDCYFTDSETSTNASNGRDDQEAGFGLLNGTNVGYPDDTTACRVIVKD